MTRRIRDLALSTVGYAGFNAVTLWAVCFLAGVVVPRTVDGPHRVGTAAAVAVDLLVLGLFAVQHSVMARRSVKARLRPEYERRARAEGSAAADAWLRQQGEEAGRYAARNC